MIKKNIFLILSFMLTVNTAMSMTEKNENIEIINLPNMETVELPVNVEKIIKPVVIENSVIKEDAQVTYIDGQTTINNINVPTKAMIINHENDKKITQIFFSIELRPFRLMEKKIEILCVPIFLFYRKSSRSQKTHFSFSVRVLIDH